MNRGMFDEPYSRCRDSQMINLVYLEIDKKFYHEWVVAKIALARSKGSLYLQLDEEGLFDCDGMWELCIKKHLLCQGVNELSVRPVLTKEGRTCQQFQDTYKIWGFVWVCAACVCLDLPLPVTYKLPKIVLSAHGATKRSFSPLQLRFSRAFCLLYLLYAHPGCDSAASCQAALASCSCPAHWGCKSHWFHS